MKTIEELQSAVDEIREVCRKHGVVLVGTWDAEGIYGEITIAGANANEIRWSGLDRRLTNMVTRYSDLDDPCVSGIGDLP